MASAAKRGRPRPKGFWAKSKRARIAWAFNRTLARIEKRSEARAIARSESRLTKEFRKALASVDVEAWARQNLKLETVPVKDGDITRIERRLVPKSKDPKPPALKIKGLRASIEQLGRDAAEVGWLRGQTTIPKDLKRARKAAWSQKAKASQGVIDLPSELEDVFLDLPAKEFGKAMGETMKLVDDINVVAREKLQVLMMDTMTEAKTFSDYARALRKKFPEFSRARANMIAVTEYRRVSSNATRQSYITQGLDGKQWNTVGDARVCPVCEANEEQGPIPIDEEFQGGEQNPPQHPLCRCNISAKRLKKAN